jgi:DNA-binding FadR family transcriptional regulator
LVSREWAWRSTWRSWRTANQYLIGAYRLMTGGIAAPRTHNLLATEKARENVLTEHRALIAAITKGELGRAEDILAEHVLKMRIRHRTQRGREPAVESA